MGSILYAFCRQKTQSGQRRRKEVIKRQRLEQKNKGQQSKSLGMIEAKAKATVTVASSTKIVILFGRAIACILQKLCAAQSDGWNVIE